MQGFFRAIFFALLLSFLFGCARDDDSFLGKAYHNFSSYFNAYYNASVEFEKGLLTLKQSQTLTTSSKLSIFQNEEQSTSGKTHFEKVIAKTSNILNTHPTSDLADNALLLMGKSYFYTNELQPAERKFKEILTNYPSSDIFDEASFWYGRSLARQLQTQAASQILRSVIESEKTSDEVKAKCYFLLAELALNNNDLEKATALIEAGLVLEENDDLKTIAAYTLARIYDKLHRFKKAAQTYKFLLNLTPSYEMYYVAQLNTGIALREQSRPEAAIQIFQDLLSDGNNLEKFGEIRFELATAYAENDDLGPAFDLYQDIIYRHPRTEAASKSFYQLGKLRLKISKDFETAKALFDSSAAAYPRGNIAKDAKDNSGLLKTLLELYDANTQLDSIIALGVVAKETLKANDTLAIVDSLDAQEKQTATPERKRTRKDYRKSAFLARGARDAFSEATPNKTSNAPKQHFKPATDSLTLEKYKIQAIEKRMALGRFYHLTMSIPDSALRWYQLGLSELKHYTKTKLDSLPPKLVNLREVGLFSISDIYRELGETAKLDSVYQLLLAEFPESLYINRVRAHFKMPKLTRRDHMPEYALYAEAIEKLDNHQAAESLMLLHNLRSRYPNSELMPKILLGIGFVHEKLLSQPDSAIDVYQNLATNYPNSSEAGQIKAKLLAVKKRATPTEPNGVKTDLPQRQSNHAAPSHVNSVKKDTLNSIRMKQDLQKMLKFDDQSDTLQHNREKKN